MSLAKPKKVFVFNSNGEQIYSDTILTFAPYEAASLEIQESPPALLATTPIEPVETAEVSKPPELEVSSAKTILVEPTEPERAASLANYEASPQQSSSHLSQLAQELEHALSEIKHLLQLIEKLPHAALYSSRHSNTTPKVNPNMDDLLALVQSPAVHSLLGSILSKSTK